MTNFIWTHNLDPIALNLGLLQIHWYGVMYFLAFLAGYFFLRHAAKSGRTDLAEQQIDLLVFAVAGGVIVGGRLGHFLFYDFHTLVTDPLQFFTVWRGGMSFHGGLSGVIIALFFTARHFQKSILELSDLILLPTALGLFFGRLGNFINGELWGIPTAGDWGVVFLRADALPRHPSQLYEAAKNLLIFGILLQLWHSAFAVKKPGLITFSFLALYGAGRILVEQFWRAPVDGYMLGLTVGQFWSAPVLIAGLVGLSFLVLSRGGRS